MSETTITDMLDGLMANDDNTAEIAEGWSQGRAAYGGLVGAFALAATRKLVTDDKPVRSMMGSFVAPAPAGKVDVAPKIERAGRSVTQASCQVLADGNVCFQMLAAFGGSRGGASHPATRAFNPPARESISPLVTNPFMPPFLKYFDCHWVGSAPLSGSKDTNLGFWVKHNTDVSRYPAEKIVALADYPPPVFMTHFKKPIRVSSLTWSLEFVTPPEEVDSEWFYLDFDMDAASNGYTQQSGYLFAEDGTLCALSRQCMVYFE
jgi:acyl-CoA thioesterase